MAGVVAEVDWAEVRETIGPTEAAAVSPMVAATVRQSIRAVVAAMVYEFVAEAMCATICEVVAMTVAAMVSGTKTQVLGSMHRRAPAGGPACDRKRAVSTLVEQRLG